MIIDCISDLHGHYPQLEGGDLLIVAGDLLARDEYEELDYFIRWLEVQNYKKKIVIGGNHDSQLVRNPNWLQSRSIEYLCDSGTEFEDLKIWGSPWTKTFPNVNHHCKAFTIDTEEELAIKFSLIPDDIDILITHSPPYRIFDRVKRYNSIGKYSENVGSIFLRNKAMQIKPKLHIFGHIHEWGGRVFDSTITKFVNASIMDGMYDPVNKPVRIEL